MRAMSGHESEVFRISTLHKMCSQKKTMPLPCGRCSYFSFGKVSIMMVVEVVTILTVRNRYLRHLEEQISRNAVSVPHMGAENTDPLAEQPFVGNENVELVSIPHPPHLLLETPRRDDSESEQERHRSRFSRNPLVEKDCSFAQTPDGRLCEFNSYANQNLFCLQKSNRVHGTDIIMVILPSCSRFDWKTCSGIKLPARSMVS
jgi:hypothetical protein